MTFEWDEAKNAANIAKHGIGFARAIRIFEGFTVTEGDDRKDYGERRYRTLGVIEDVIVLLIVHTPRSGAVRVISARLANRAERKRYDEALR